MKDISNRRKYKLFLKDIQRNKKDGYNKIKTFFANKGVFIIDYDVYFIFNALSPEKFNRFMKLCTRIGGAAKKRNCFIKAINVFNCVRHPFSHFSDPRQIPFYKCEIVTENIEKTHYIYVPEKEEAVLSYFKVNTFFSKNGKTTTSKREPSTLKEILQLI